MAYTSKDYCNKLREIAGQLGRGEIEEYRIDLTQLSEVMEPDDYEKIRRNISYTRTIANRVPDVKAVGAISIRVDEDEFAKYYVLTLNRDVKRKVITTEDVAKLESDWKAKFIRHLLQTHPKFTDLEGEKLEGAIEMIRRYEDMLQKMAKEDN